MRSPCCISPPISQPMFPPPSSRFPCVTSPSLLRCWFMVFTPLLLLSGLQSSTIVNPQQFLFLCHSFALSQSQALGCSLPTKVSQSPSWGRSLFSVIALVTLLAGLKPFIQLSSTSRFKISLFVFRNSQYNWLAF
jgi:hypothetical protein